MKAMKALVFACCALIASAASAQWEYNTRADKMTGKTKHITGVVSTNSLNLAFPYAGTNYGRIIVRQEDGKAPEVFVTVDEGQILCRLSDCSLRVRFDENQPIRMSGSPPDDHSSRIVFINQASKFIAAAQKAKRILIEMSFYKNGNQILEFDTPVPLALPQRSKK